MFQALGRVLTIFLQSSGHTCGIEDLTLTIKAERERKEIIRKVSRRVCLRLLLEGFSRVAVLVRV